MEDIRKEHRRALMSGNVQQSAVAEHASKEMHDIDWEMVEIVDCYPHYRGVPWRRGISGQNPTQ